MDEPSVLDYLKAKLQFWRKIPMHIPEAAPDVELLEQAAPISPRVLVYEPEAAEPVRTAAAPLKIPWRGLAAFLVGLTAQFSVEPPDRSVQTSVWLFGIAAVLVVWAALRGEWQVASPHAEERQDTSFRIYRDAFFISLPFALLAFLAFGSGRFTLLNVLLWIAAIGFFLRALWIQNPGQPHWLTRVWRFLGQPCGQITFNPWIILIIAGMALAIFFRFYQLNQVPPEMVSDQAEKLLDVADVLDGRTAIFFPRNTGREALQFYLTAAVIQFFNTGLTFLSLKIGTGIAGLLTLPYIYLLGKEVGNRWVGLFALVFAGMAYWPNLITRIGLRFSLYPLFVAPVLFYLIRGLRTSNRNDFLLAGLALGIGLHGYTSIRILPFVVVIGVGLYLIHRQSLGQRQQTIFNLILLALVAFMVFLPLFRYALSDPDLFAYRAFTRLSDWERPLPAPAWQIFLQNLWNSMTMFFWSNGGIWVHSIPGRPALDVVSGALFFAGQVLLLVRYLRKRHWLDLFLLLSVPLLMLPSILSLAFPDENPSLNRSAGAYIPVFIILGVALDGWLRSLRERLEGRLGNSLAVLFVVVLIAWSARQNFDLVFNQYQQTYRMNAWNTTEIGRVIRGFADSVGSPESAWVVGFPHWVDTRLVGMNAGYPRRDYAIWPENIPETRGISQAKLFILNLQDIEGIQTLRNVYPQGSLQRYRSQVLTKDFYIYLVPPDGGNQTEFEDGSSIEYPILFNE